MESMTGKEAEYAQISDEALIDRLRQGEEPIVDYICDKYKNLVRSQAKSMFLLGADKEDLIQEGMIGLFKAVRDYDRKKDASFYTFAQLCISRQMYTAVQAAKRQKHQPLNTYVSLDFHSTSQGEKETDTFSPQMLQQTGSNPEEMVLDRERITDLEKKIETQLSEFEKQVLDLYLTGMSYTEIARVLGREEKATDNALQRLKAKIKRML